MAFYLHYRLKCEQIEWFTDANLLSGRAIQYSYDIVMVEFTTIMHNKVMHFYPSD